MAKKASDLIVIMRNVTGRIDASDPLFSDAVMLQYINDFMTLEMAQEIRINQQEAWLEFDMDPTSPNPFPIDLQNPPGAPTYYPVGTQFTTIGPPAYVQLTTAVPPDQNNSFELWWYQSPEQFYWRWPEGQIYQPQRPTDVLYYKNALTFRGPLDQLYHIKIQAYQVSYELISPAPDGNPTADQLSQDYLWRYIAYGAALDLLSDYVEMDTWNQIYPIFRRYRALVQARSYSQNMNQRSLPRF